MKNKKENNMSSNMKKSRRKWEYSGYKECHECKTYNYDTFTSYKPHRLTLCHPCWHWIYEQDRKPMSLFDNLEGEK